jgi:hypothetical protein
LAEARDKIKKRQDLAKKRLKELQKKKIEMKRKRMEEKAILGYDRFAEGVKKNLQKQSTLAELLCGEQCQSIDENRSQQKTEKEREKKQAVIQAKREKQRADQLQVLRKAIGEEFFEEFTEATKNHFRAILTPAQMLKLPCPPCRRP